MDIAERCRHARENTSTILENFKQHNTLKIPAIAEPNLRFVCEEKITNKQKLGVALKNKLWRLNNLYSISDRNAKYIPFVMTEAQWEVYLKSIGFKRTVILKSRQQGISTLWVISFLDDCIFNKNMKAGLVSYGIPQRQDMLDRVMYSWDYFPQEIKAMLGISRTTKNRSKEVSFSNYSKLLITSKFRGTTLQRLHISELGKMASTSPMQAEELMSGDMQTLHEQSKAVVESTAEGENLLTDIWHNGVAAFDEETGTIINPEAFRPIFLSWMNDPRCVSKYDLADTDISTKYFEDKPEATQEQKNFWIAQYSTTGENTYREYPATPEEAFRSKTEGRIYAKQYTDLVKTYNNVPHPFASMENDGILQTRAPIYVSFDLGIRDPTFITFFQAYKNNIRFLYEKQLQDTEASMDNIDQLLHDTMNNVIKPAAPYSPYKFLIVPHDIRQRLQGEEVKSRYDILSEKGWRNMVIAKKISTESLAQVQATLKYAHIDLKHCPLLDKAFRNYRAEFKTAINDYSDKPLHDKFSHPMDSVAYGISYMYKQIELGEFKSNYKMSSVI